MESSGDPTQLRGIGAFGMVPEWLLVADISSTAKVVFAWMACKYANRATWGCWPGQARLASDLGLSVNTIAAALRELADVGALTKRARVDESGAPSTNYYQLMFLPPSPRKLGDPQKTGGPLPQKTGDKPEVLEPEVQEPEVRAFRVPDTQTMIESPLQWHRRHGGHVAEFCDWMCFPAELAGQFATRAGMTDAEVMGWAKTVRQEWQAAQRVPVGGMWEWWNKRWAERQTRVVEASTEDVSRMARYYATRAEDEAAEREREERRRKATREEMRRIAALREEIWNE